MAQRPRKNKQPRMAVAPASPGDEIISLEECKGILEGFELTDERVLQIRNSVVGLVDSFLSAYVAGLKEERGR